MPRSMVILARSPLPVLSRLLVVHWMGNAGISGGIESTTVVCAADGVEPSGGSVGSE